MERLSLDDFRLLQFDENKQEQEELEKLTGGILGACHCNVKDCKEGPPGHGGHCL